ncbi:MAG: HNH endonuclease [Chloroflexia bacterium]
MGSVHGRTRDDIDAAKVHIIAQLTSGVPKSDICAQFKCKPDTLNRRLKAWGVNHLNNMAGRNRPKYGARKPLADCLVANSTTQTYGLKLRLWRDEIKPQYCEECGWAKRAADGRLPLELDHINGDPHDNRLENLRILCPNCHSLRENHRGLSKGKFRRQRGEQVAS